jgi:hypothetical protein
MPKPTTWLLVAALSLAGVNVTAARDNNKSCNDEVGARRAELYVDECILVAPSIHAPCNVSNSCETIISEVKFGCEIIHTALIKHPEYKTKGVGHHRLSEPGFCKQYTSK